MDGIETIFDINGLADNMIKIGKYDISRHGLRKHIESVWSDPVRRKEPYTTEKDYWSRSFTPGMRITSQNTVCMYSIASVYQLKHCKLIANKNASPEGARRIMQEKRNAAAGQVTQFRHKLNSDDFRKLKDYDKKLYCLFQLFGTSLYELSVSLISVNDIVMVSVSDQRILIEIADKIFPLYQRDLDEFITRIERYEFDCSDVFESLQNTITNCQIYIDQIRNQIPLDRKKYIDAAKMDLKKRIRQLNPNDEFPPLICELLRSQGYFDIVITQDTRDDGCDIWATATHDKKNEIHMFSLKRYTTSNISVNCVNDLYRDMQKHSLIDKAHLIATASISQNAVEVLKEKSIAYMDMDAIIESLMDGRIGISQNCVIDEGFWDDLEEKKLEYRKGPIGKYTHFDDDGALFKAV